MVTSHRTSLKNTQKNGNSNWKETQNKYRTEKWGNLSMPEKKVISIILLYLFICDLFILFV